MRLYEDTVPLDDTIAIGSPSLESEPLGTDMNTEVLDGRGSPQQSGDQMEDYLEKGVVLDSDDEEGNQNEAVNLVKSAGVAVRFPCREVIGLLGRQQAPAGYFRRLNKVSEHVLHCPPSDINEKSDKEATAGRIGVHNDNESQECRVAVDSVVLKSSGQKPVPMEREGLTEEFPERKSSSHESNYMDMGKGANYKELNYRGSPQVAESQDKALQFVDDYLSVCGLGSYKDGPTAKTDTITIKSPPSFRSMGSQSLARRLTLGSTASKLTTFDWAENHVEKADCAKLRQYNDSILGGFGGERCGSVSVNKEFPNCNLQNETSILQPEGKLPGNMLSPNNLDTVLLSSNDTEKIGSNSAVCIIPDSMELDDQLDESYVGLDTQIAAEAMEELLHAGPPRDDACFTHQVSDNILSDTTNTVNNNNGTSNIASQKVAFVDWRRKEKRSKSVKIPIVKEKKLSKPAAKQFKNKRRTISQRVVGRNLMTKKLMAEENTDTVKGKENCYLNPVPKGKQTLFSTPNHAANPCNQSSPFAAIDNNIRIYPTLKHNEQAVGRVAELSVYSNQRKVSSVNRQVETAFDSNANKPLKQYRIPEGSEEGKQSATPISNSPLLKELTRLGYTGSSPNFLPKDSRRRRAMDKVCILFSQNLDTATLKKQKKIVARLGFSVASSPSDATHFIADKFVRTRNMLEVIALGKPVVTHLWLQSCKQTGYVIDEKSYILRDEKKEKEFGFNMHATLTRSSQLPLLKGRRVFITPNVKPDIDVINSLVKAVKGEVVKDIPNAKMKNELIRNGLLILSSEEDYAICLQFIQTGASIYDSELLLNGIVTQKLEFERYRLFKDLKRKR